MLLAKGRGGAEREFYDSTLNFRCPPVDQGKGWTGQGILQFYMGLKKHMFNFFCLLAKGREGAEREFYNSTLIFRCPPGDQGKGWAG